MIDFINLGIIILFVGITNIINYLVYRKFVDYKKVEKLKKEINELRKKMKGLNAEEKFKVSEEILQKNVEIMGEMQKSLLITMIPFILMFYLLKMIIKTPVFTFPFELPFIGNSLGYLGTYILLSFLLSPIFRKVLKY